MLFTSQGQSVLEKIVPCVLSTALGLCKIKFWEQSKPELVNALFDTMCLRQ